MEKINENEQAITTYTHSFYCDDCEKYLGTTEEDSDGWYDDIGDIELSFYVVDKWYKLEKHFCDDCKAKFLARLKGDLEDMGFVKDKTHGN